MIDKYEKIILDSGLQFIFSNSPKYIYSSISIIYRIGSELETNSEGGIRNLITNIFNNCTPLSTNDDIDNIFRKLDVFEWGASTTYDYMLLDETLPNQQLKSVISLEALRYKNLLNRIDAQKLEIIKSIIHMRKKQRESIQESTIIEKLYPIPHPYNSSIYGSEKSIHSLTITQVKEFFLRHYTPDKITISIVGDFESSTIIDILNKQFKNSCLISKDTYHISTTQHNINISSEKIRIGEPGPSVVNVCCKYKSLYDKEYFGLKIIHSFLVNRSMSRFNIRLVSKSICQRVLIKEYLYRFGSYFVIEFTSKHPELTKNISNTFQEEIDKILNSPLNDDELESSKNHLLMEYMKNTQSIRNKARVANLINCHINDPNQIITNQYIIRGLSNIDIQSATKKVFNKKNILVYELIP